jgi:hypothetical protein
MGKELARIIRSDEVKLEGCFRLNANQAGKSNERQMTEDRQWQVSIVENHEEFAIIEISCCCGERMYLRCEYASTNAIETVEAVQQSDA